MPNTETLPTKPAAGAVRRGDALFVVHQHNEDKSLVIHAMNTAADQLLGYSEGEIIGRKFETVLGPSTAELLAEDVEFDDDAPDVGEVLSRIRELRLRNRAGQEITTPFTISRLVSDGKNASFQLTIPDEKEVLADQKIRNFIALNLEGHKQLDAGTGLPNRATALEFIPLLRNYMGESGIDISIAVIKLDRHAKSVARYGAPACVTLLQHAANCCSSSFRSEDIIFALSDHTLGVVLFDISRESARVVFNRLRWNIRSHRIDFGGKPDFSVTTTICFDMLTKTGNDSVIESCEARLAAADAEERNALLEIGQ